MSLPDPVVLALVAVALGPSRAALWATGGYRTGGSHRWARALVHVLFWGCIAVALALTAFPDYPE